MRCGVRAVLRILLCALGVGVELGRALRFGLCYGLLCRIWAALRLLFCASGFGVVVGGCFGLMWSPDY